MAVQSRTFPISLKERLLGGNKATSEGAWCCDRQRRFHGHARVGSSKRRATMARQGRWQQDQLNRDLAWEGEMVAGVVTMVTEYTGDLLW